jgi:hypothetical protein
MNLDKRVDMLTDEQVVELEPIIDFLSKDPSMNYKIREFIINSSSVKEAILIEAYNSDFAKEENYRSVVDACAEKILTTNTLHMLLHYSNNNEFSAGYYLQKNFQLRRLMDSKK